MSAVRGWWRRAAVIVASGVFLTGCGSDGTPEAQTPGGKQSANPNAVGEADAANVRQETGGERRIPSPKLLDRRARLAVAPDSLGLIKSAGGPPKTSAAIYKDIAPATVIVRVPNGLGSGVVIDPAGWVLTNHHVVDGGKKEDFTVKVQVLLGKISKDGSMERGEKTYDAVVYKADKLRDLALIKITDPPGKLKAVPLAEKPPAPGQQVISLGHAGAGMLWAIKAGEISALGKLSEQLSTLARFDDDEEGRKASDQFKKFLEKQNLGLVIQTTCNILPGDSGGPLVSRDGALVGLNAFSNKDRQTGGLLSFHVHLDEIKKFLKPRPKKPASMVPDPWDEGGGDAAYEDADLDGRVDVLLMKGRRPCRWCPLASAAIFVDADQSSFPGVSELPALTDVYEKRSFDAEMVYLRQKEESLVFYDTDNDGRFDVLLYDEKTSGAANAGYRIGKDGSLKKEEALAGGPTIRPSLFAKAPDRLGRIASAVFPATYVESSTSLSEVLPSPVGKTGKGMVADLDRDGKMDSIRVAQAFSSRLVLDLSQSTVPRMRPIVDMEALGQSNLLDAELSVVTQASQVWVWYDSDDDGRMDVVLHSPGLRLYTAKYAWKVDASGNKTAAPEHLGRKLIRPGVFGRQSLTERLQAMIDKRSFLSIMSASKDDGVGSFPDPIEDHRGAGYELLDIKNYSKAVVAISGQGSDGYLIDLDQSSLRGKARKKIDIEKTVTDGKFTGDFAYFQRNGMVWVFYDTDGKQGYDTVLYSTSASNGTVEQGFRINARKQAVVDEDLKDKPLVMPSLMKSKRDQRRLKLLVKDLFASRMVEADG